MPLVRKPSPVKDKRASGWQPCIDLSWPLYPKANSDPVEEQRHYDARLPQVTTVACRTGVSRRTVDNFGAKPDLYAWSIGLPNRPLSTLIEDHTENRSG